MKSRMLSCLFLGAVLAVSPAARVSAGMGIRLDNTVISNSGALRSVRVTTASELFTALKTAEPGDDIILAPGTYVGKLGGYYSGHGSSFFNSDIDGTKEHPIFLRSEDPEDPAVLYGERDSTGNVLRITGDYWVVEDIEVTHAQKGIMLDNSNHTVIKNVYIHDVGMEGLHFRDGSSYCMAENCTITNTGLASPGYGEAVYVGSAKNSWETYESACDHNIVRGCRLGPGVTAEHVDIKEGTTGTVIESCVMDGTGISGNNYADSFIDIKGNGVNIRYNTCRRNGNEIITDAIQLHSAVESWGYNNYVFYNTVYMDTEEGYVINATHDTEAVQSMNTRVPEGQMYTGEVYYICISATPTPFSKPTVTHTPTQAPTTAPSRAPELSGWVRDNGVWKYYKNGVPATGWLKDGGKWYYLDPQKDGAMVKGWKKTGGKWYYLDPSSGAMRTGIIKTDGKTYICGTSGELCLNKWISIGGAWYKTDPQGEMLVNKWVRSGGKWYYLMDDGRMAADRDVMIGGELYSFDAGGVWIES